MPGDVAAALRRQYPLDHRITVYFADGSSTEVQLDDIGPSAHPLPTEAMALYVPPLRAELALGSPHGLRAIVHRLRAPGGCPWDREQTPLSLTRYVLEEAYEVVDAIERGTDAERCEELGDLLLQVYLQAAIAEESGEFDLTEVIRALSQKLIRRHPHVFGSVEVGSAAEVERNWELLKQAERQKPTSALERVPLSLPALARAAEVQRQLSKAGFDWPRPEGAWAKLDEELEELRSAVGDTAAMEKELGDLLFMVAKVGRDAGIDPEAALRGTIQRVMGRYGYLERAAAGEGRAVGELGIERLLELWQDAKRAELSDQA